MHKPHLNVYWRKEEKSAISSTSRMSFFLSQFNTISWCKVSCYGGRERGREKESELSDEHAAISICVMRLSVLVRFEKDFFRDKNYKNISDLVANSETEHLVFFS